METSQELSVADLDVQVSTAKKYPRNLRSAIENCITAITISSKTADDCIYSLKKGGKPITGPSVYLARIVARNLGNMRVDQRVVSIDAETVTCEATAFDLETNYAVRTTIKRSIVGSSGRYSNDMITIVATAGAAIAFRNAVFSVIDSAVIEKLLSVARNKIVGDISSEDKFTARKVEIIKNLKQNYPGLSDDEILKSVNKESISHLTTDDLVTLIGYEKSIQSGEQRFEEIFRPSNVMKKAVQEEKESSRLISLMQGAKTKKDLEKFKQHIENQTQADYYAKRLAELQ